MAGNPVLGFLSVQPTGDGPHATVTKMLRLLGIVVLVGVGLSVLNAVLLLAMGNSYYGGALGGFLAAGAVGGLIVSLLIAAAICFWITFTINAWANHDPRGATHALIIGIIAAVLGALGVLSNLAVFGVFAGYPIYGVINLLSLLLAAAEAYCGIMILMNRSKAIGTSSHPTGTTN
jgi:hypothetical protein